MIDLKPIKIRSVIAYQAAWPATSLLAQLSQGVFDQILEVGRTVAFESREAIIRFGAAEQTVHLLLSGCVKVTSEPDERGREPLLAIRVGGDVIGELAALDRRPRSANAYVCGRDAVIACSVDGDRFVEIVSQSPEDLVLVTASVTAKLRAANRRRRDYFNCIPQVAMARVLLELVQQHGRRLPSGSVLLGVDLRQVELGSLIGVHEPTAHRALTGLRDAGIIDTAHRMPIILDMSGLRRAALLDGDAIK